MTAEPPTALSGIRPVLHLPFGGGIAQPIVHSELRALVETMLLAGVESCWALPRRHGRSASLNVTRSSGEPSTPIGGRVPLVVGVDGSTSVAVHIDLLLDRLAAEAVPGFAPTLRTVVPGGPAVRSVPPC